MKHKHETMLAGTEISESSVYLIKPLTRWQHACCVRLSVPTGGKL